MIRRATEADRASIWYVAEKAKEYQPHLEIDRDKIDRMMDLWFTEPDDKSVILLSEISGVPVGCLVGRAEEHIWHKGRVALEVLWWTDTKHPDQTKHLIGAFEWWAKHVGCSHVSLTAAPDKIKIVSRAYARMGYIDTERLFLKEI